VDGSRLLIRAAVPDDLDPIASIHTAARLAYYRGFVPDEVLAGPVAAVRGRLILSERMHDCQCTVLCAEAKSGQGGQPLASSAAASFGWERSPGHLEDERLWRLPDASVLQ
jgi:hypothetical protein